MFKYKRTGKRITGLNKIFGTVYFILYESMDGRNESFHKRIIFFIRAQFTHELKLLQKLFNKPYTDTTDFRTFGYIIPKSSIQYLL